MQFNVFQPPYGNSGIVYDDDDDEVDEDQEITAVIDMHPRMSGQLLEDDDAPTSVEFVPSQAWFDDGWDYNVVEGGS